MNNHELYEQLAEKMRRLSDLMMVELKNADARLTATLIEEAKKVQNGSRVNTAKGARKILGEARVAELVEEASHKYDRSVAPLRQEQKEVKEKMQATLRTMTPEACEDEWKVVDSTWYSTYASQGFGASKYAREKAEMIAQELRNGSPGINIRVRELRDLTRGRHPNYAIEAQVPTELDALIVKYRRQSSDLVELVRQCWARGVNPRVYYPALPHGFEEQYGLDRFGGTEVRK